MRVHPHVRAHVLGSICVLGLVPAHTLVLHGIPGGAILTSLPDLEGTVEGVDSVGLGPEGVEEEVDAVDTVKLLGLGLHHVAGVQGLHGDDRQATSVPESTEGADRGRPHTLCVPVGHGRDLTLVPAPALHTLARGRALCLILPIQGTVGAGAGVAPVLDLRVVEGGVTAKMIFETAVVGRSRQGISCSYPFLHIRFDRLSEAINHSHPSTFVILKCTICEPFNPRVQREEYQQL